MVGLREYVDDRLDKMVTEFAKLLMEVSDMGLRLDRFEKRLKSGDFSIFESESVEMVEKVPSYTEKTFNYGGSVDDGYGFSNHMTKGTWKKLTPKK